MKNDKWAVLAAILTGSNKALSTLDREDRIYFLALQNFSSRFDHEFLPGSIRPRSEIQFLLPATSYMHQKPYTELLQDFSTVLSVAKICIKACNQTWDVNAESLTDFITRHGKDRISCDVLPEPLETVTRFWRKTIKQAQQDILCSDYLSAELVMPLPSTQHH